jgi:hypothetical protein
LRRNDIWFERRRETNRKSPEKSIDTVIGLRIIMTKSESNHLVGSSLTSYSEGHGLKTRSGDWLSGLRIFLIFLTPVRHAGGVQQVRPGPFLSTHCK